VEELLGKADGLMGWSGVKGFAAASQAVQQANGAGASQGKVVPHQNPGVMRAGLCLGGIFRHPQGCV